MRCAPKNATIVLASVLSSVGALQRDGLTADPTKACFDAWGSKCPAYQDSCESDWIRSKCAATCGACGHAHLGFAEGTQGNGQAAHRHRDVGSPGKEGRQSRLQPAHKVLVEKAAAEKAACGCGCAPHAAGHRPCTDLDTLYEEEGQQPVLAALPAAERKRVAAELLTREMVYTCI